MSLKTFVKISKIDNLSDARYCAGMMADILGFNVVEGTESYVTPDKFKEITDWLAGIEFCIELGSADTNTIKQSIELYNANFIETTNIESIKQLSNINQRLIFKIEISENQEIDKLIATIDEVKSIVAYVIIKCNDRALHNSLIETLNSSDTPNIIKGFDITDENATSVLSENCFVGLELEGTPEDRPGFKDYGQVMDILELLEED